MESYRIQHHIQDTNKRQHSSDTIVSIVCSLKKDFESLFDYEKDWEYVWELLQIVLQEVGFGTYCVEPLIRDIYERYGTKHPEDTKQKDLVTLQELKQLELPEQRTPAWFQFRQTRLTASELSYCVGGNTNQSVQKKIMLQKICPEAVPYVSSAATSHGTLFEPVAQYMYERLYGVTLYEFGCVPHAKVSWLAASPDGISEDAIMVEIKCPYSRTPTGVPSLTYYTQIQAQLEVCDLEWCDFMECVIESYSDRKSYIRDTAPKQCPKIRSVLSNSVYRGMRREYLPSVGILKGVAILLETNEGTKMECISLQEMCQISSKDWINTTLQKWYTKEGVTVSGYTLQHWILKEIWITRIQRNRQWFHTEILPKAEAFWNTLLEKKNSNEIKIPEKKTIDFVEETI